MSDLYLGNYFSLRLEAALTLIEPCMTLQGYDRRPPHRPSQHQMMTCMEATLGSLDMVSMYREVMSEGASTLKQYTAQMHDCVGTMHESLQVLCATMDSDPRSHRQNSIANMKMGDYANGSNIGNDSPIGKPTLSRNNSGGDMSQKSAEWSNKKSTMVDELNSIFAWNERETDWDDELMALDGQQPLDSDEVCSKVNISNQICCQKIHASVCMSSMCVLDDTLPLCNSQVMSAFYTPTF